MFRSRSRSKRLIFTASLTRKPPAYIRVITVRCLVFFITRTIHDISLGDNTFGNGFSRQGPLVRSIKLTKTAFTILSRYSPTVAPDTQQIKTIHLLYRIDICC
jgi:hypothetical protein